MIDRIVVWALTLKAQASEERGQDIMEYAILTGTIAVALAAGLLLFTGQLTGDGSFFDRLGDFMGKLVPTS